MLSVEIGVLWAVSKLTERGTLRDVEGDLLVPTKYSNSLPDWSVVMKQSTPGSLFQSSSCEVTVKIRSVTNLKMKEFSCLLYAFDLAYIYIHVLMWDECVINASSPNPGTLTYCVKRRPAGRPRLCCERALCPSFRVGRGFFGLWEA